MQTHAGRLIDHVHLRVADLAASRRFYRAVFAALGKAEALVEGDDHFWGDELWVDRADGPVSRVHLAFQAPDRATVEAFHRAALAAGGVDHGGPGERSYHPGYYGAFVLDPDGNNIEAVFHGPSDRSAASIVITPAGDRPASDGPFAAAPAPPWTPSNEVEKRIAASFDRQGLMTSLGARLAFVGDGEVHIELPFSAHLTQQHGYAHAGAITSIVDSAGGYAALTRAPADCEVVTAEFKINLMRPAIGERFVAIGKVQNAGKLLTVCTGEVRAHVGAGGAGGAGSDAMGSGAAGGGAAAGAGGTVAGAGTAATAPKVVALMQATFVNVRR